MFANDHLNVNLEMVLLTVFDLIYVLSCMIASPPILCVYLVFSVDDMFLEEESAGKVRISCLIRTRNRLSHCFECDKQSGRMVGLGVS